jgi:hypothetical protein
LNLARDQLYVKDVEENKIPLNETVISPGEMFSSDLLVTVTQK